MIKMDITLDNDILQRIASLAPGFLNKNSLPPATRANFDVAAMIIQKEWRDWALGGTLDGIPDIKTPSPKLYESIKIRDIGVLDKAIVSDSTHAQRIQDGTPELDMKTTHPYGKKSRVSKEGIPYLIVPLRWGTPNDKGGKRAHWGNFIPALLFEKQFAKMKTSKTTGYQDVKSGEIIGHVHTEPNYRGQDIIRSEYQWGDRHEGDGNMDGMVRMAGKAGYLTFRVISALQLITAPHAWIRKAVQPIDVLGALENKTRPMVEELIRAGLEADFGI